jgi:hypothetical protein
VENKSGGGGWQELRQVLRDLFDLQSRGGLNTDNLLLVLSLVNIFGIVELLGRRQGTGEGQDGQFLGRLLGSLVSGQSPARTGDEEAGYTGLKALPGGKGLMNLLGGKEGVKTLTALLSNKEIVDSVLPLLQGLGTGFAARPKASPESAKAETTPARKGPGREVIRWDFGRSDIGRDRDDAG